METVVLRGLELRSRVSASGELVLSLEDVEVVDPGPEEVVVRVEAAPLNPSDIGLLLGPADLATLRAEGTPERPVLVASVPAARLGALALWLDQSMPAGNEGAGTVVRAGSGVQEMVGKTVGMLGGAMYTRYRTLSVESCIALPEGAVARDGASMSSSR